MSSSQASTEARAVEVAFSEDELLVRLTDGRRIAAPLAWFPRLLAATAPQRQNFRILADGVGIHWPDIDEDLSVAGLLRGTPAR